MNESDLERHIRDIKSGAFHHRIAAVSALTGVRDLRADAALLSALRDENRAVRFAALNALISSDPDRPVEPVLNALRGSDETHPPSQGWESATAREIISFGLVHLSGVRAVEVLGDALKDSDDRRLRHEAAIALGKTADARAIAPLMAALADPHEPVRREAARSLGDLRHPDVISALLPSLDDPSKHVRRVASRALLRNGLSARSASEFGKKAKTASGRQAARRLARRALLKKLAGG